ncbi:hypothetical protein SAMN04489711_12914 [Paracidovorax wautersii]|uniref:Uncharacterized protein n=1 Tax=Paracidovorax wautersii TaxID=1177982 RepID=A0A1I2HV29_9BURK|nr:hypothetical protein SAMN04489711_12914 [Paracidovorax wautersii]
MACPGYQRSLQSSLAGAYERVSIAGTVKVEFRVRDGAVVDVTPMAGLSEYYRTVCSAVRRFHCQAPAERGCAGVAGYCFSGGVGRGGEQSGLRRAWLWP